MTFNMSCHLVAVTLALVFSVLQLHNASGSGQTDSCSTLGGICTCRYDRRRRMSIDCQVTEQWPSFVDFNTSYLVREFRAFGRIAQLPYSALRGSTTNSAHLERLGLSRIGDGSFEGSGAHLTTLYLDGNRLSYVPSFLLRQLPRLVYLSVTSNLLTRLPDMRVPSPKLRYLLAGDNHLTTPPPYLPNSLQTLILKSNQLESWIGSGYNDKAVGRNGVRVVVGGESVEMLDISHNQLKDVKGMKLDSALKLDLSSNRLQAISLDNAPKLRYLDISSNLLRQVLPFQSSSTTNDSSISTWLDDMSSLRHLDLSSNLLVQVPSSLPYMLVKFACSSNHITSLDLSHWSSIIELQQLDLSDNRIVKIKDGHDGVGSKGSPGLTPPSLRSLLLANNRIGKLPDLQLFQESPYISILDLSNNRLSDLKTKSGNFFAGARNLYDLNLSWNNLSSVDASQLPTTVNMLRLSSNSIESLDIQGIKGLTSLHLDFNSLEQFPIFSSGSSLEHLGLSNNKIEKFDRYSIHRLHNLRSLSLAHNHISGILQDDLISSCIRLYTIDLSHNFLTEVNRYAFFNGESLSHVNLANNRIRTLQETCFRERTKIVELRLSHNVQLSNPGKGALSDLKSLRKLYLDGVTTLGSWLPEIGVADGVSELDLTGSLVNCSSCKTIQWLRDHEDITIEGGRETFCNSNENQATSQEVDAMTSYWVTGIPALCVGNCKLVPPVWCANTTTRTPTSTPSDTSTSMEFSTTTKVSKVNSQTTQAEFETTNDAKVTSGDPLAIDVTTSALLVNDQSTTRLDDDTTVERSSEIVTKHIPRETDSRLTKIESETSDAWDTTQQVTDSSAEDTHITDNPIVVDRTTSNDRVITIQDDSSFATDESNTKELVTDRSSTKDSTIEIIDDVTNKQDTDVTQHPSIQISDYTTHEAGNIVMGDTTTIKIDDDITKGLERDVVTQDSTIVLESTNILGTDSIITRGITNDVVTDSGFTEDLGKETEFDITKDIGTDGMITKDSTIKIDNDFTNDVVTDSDFTEDLGKETEFDITKDIGTDGMITKDSTIKIDNDFTNDVVTDSDFTGDLGKETEFDITKDIGTDNRVTRDSTIDPTIENGYDITKDLGTDNTQVPSIETGDYFTKDNQEEETSVEETLTYESITIDYKLNTDNRITKFNDFATDDNAPKDLSTNGMTTNSKLQTDDNITKDHSLVTRDNTNIDQKIYYNITNVYNSNTSDTTNTTTREPNFEIENEFTKRSLLNDTFNLESTDTISKLSDAEVTENIDSTTHGLVDETIEQKKTSKSIKVKSDKSLVTEVDEMITKRNNENDENKKVKLHEKGGNESYTTGNNTSRNATANDNATTSNSKNGTLCPTSSLVEVFAVKETTTATIINNDNSSLTP